MSTLNTRPDPQETLIADFVMLTPGETEAHHLFSHLARATSDELVNLGFRRNVFRFFPDSGEFGSALIKTIGADVSRELRMGWQRFADQYPELAARNPRLELYDLMQDISERTEFASWPSEWEWDIEEWMSDGAPHGWMPYRGIDDDIRDRLLELHPILSGWLYINEAGTLTFADTEAFRKVKLRLDAEREERIRVGRAEHDANMKRIEWARRDTTAVQVGGVTIYLKDKAAPSGGVPFSTPLPVRVNGGVLKGTPPYAVLWHWIRAQIPGVQWATPRSPIHLTRCCPHPPSEPSR